MRASFPNAHFADNHKLASFNFECLDGYGKLARWRFDEQSEPFRPWLEKSSCNRLRFVSQLVDKAGVVTIAFCG